MQSQADLATRFGIADYGVFAAMLALSMGIGFYYACSGDRQRTAKAFLMADRNMGVVPVSLSLFASFISAPAILGIPIEVYTYGTSYWIMTFSFLFVLPITAYFYMPVFFDLELTSSYEYLERRFNKCIRKISSAIFIANMIMFLAMVTYVPAMALSQVTGMHVWASVSVIGVVCTIYTTMGGMKAVIITDSLQVFIMLFSMAAVAVRGLNMLGGFTNVWITSYNGGRLQTFNFDPSPLVRHTFWSLILGSAIMWLSVYGVNQTQVQRYLTSPTKLSATKALWINLPAQFIFISLAVLVGMIMYTKYATCDPLSIHLIETKIQMLPLLVMETTSDLPGLPGLFVAGLFSASLSTLSSGLNSLAAVTLEDFVRPHCYPKLSERQAGLISKFIAFIYGISALGLIAVVEQLGNILEAVFSLFGMVSAPLFGLFSLGMFFPCANSYGAGIGFISGLVLVFWLGIGTFIVKPFIPELPVSIADCNSTLKITTVVLQNITEFPPKMENYSVYNVSYLWYSAIGFGTVIVVGLVISHFTNIPDSNPVDPRLLSPPIRKFFTTSDSETKTRTLCFKFSESSKQRLSVIFGQETDVNKKNDNEEISEEKELFEPNVQMSSDVHVKEAIAATAF